MKSIGTKIFLIITLCLVVVSAFQIYTTYSISNANIREAVMREASMALKYNVAIRAYVADVIRPIMYDLVGKDRFIPETMSTSFVSYKIFAEVQKQFPSYILKFSSDNPRNPENQAGPEELRMIRYFNSNPQLKEWVGEINIDNVQYMAKFRARRMEESCLHCHGVPADAPASLVDAYGVSAGFHRPVGEVIALDTVAVPMQKVFAQLFEASKVNMLVSGVSLLLFSLAVFLTFRTLVSKRLAVIALHFQGIAGKNDFSGLEPIHLKGNDEITSLAESFNTLTKRLKEFYLSLEEQVMARTRELEETNEHLQLEIEIRKHTEEKLQKTNEFYKIVLDSLNDDVSIIDVGNYQILGVNQVFLRDYGVSASEAIGRKCHQVTHGLLLPCGLPDDPCPMVQTVNTGAHAKAEHIHYHPDRGMIYVEVSTSPITDDDGKVVQVVHVARDITLGKEAEKNMAAAKEKAEEASRAKSEFLANMSHEIRTPLNGIIGMAELALDTAVDDNQRKIFKTINTEVLSLLGIINDILDFSKIEAGKLDLEHIPFDLRILVEDMVAGVALRAEKKGLEFVFYFGREIPCKLIGDPGRIRQILINLVGNALKFTHRGEVFLKVELLESKDRRVKIRFQIVDTGIGISAANQKKIFESFTQADGSTTRRYGGTGLGTAISKQLVNLMGGDIRVESAEGVGSTFSFTVVLDRQEVGVARLPEPDIELKGKLVLVVDDNLTNLSILSGYLKSWGCEPVTVADAVEALDILHHSQAGPRPFELIITDLKMPGMDGFAFSRAVKTAKDQQKIPILVLTSIGTTGDGRLCQEIGIEGYLTKPIRHDELENAIKTVLAVSSEPLMMTDAKLVTRHLLTEDLRDRVYHILLVEDYPTNQQVAMRHLTGAGYQVDCVEDGLQAVEACKRKKYDLVLMDIQMPVMDGYEATKAIRKAEEELKIEAPPSGLNGSLQAPIVAMTAHALKSDRDKCLAVGMNDYISKPLRRKELLAIVGKWLTMPARSGRTSMPVSAIVLEANAAVKYAPIDFSRILEEFDGDKDFVLHMIQTFQQEGRVQMELIRQALEQNDVGLITDEAHKLKSGAASIGADGLAALARELELSGRSGDETGCKTIYAQFLAEFNRLDAYADNLLKQVER